MGDLVFINVAKRQQDLVVQEAWDNYLAAKVRADETRAIADGIAAGKAWRAFLDLFAGKRA